MHDTIIDAIAGRNELEFSYGGFPRIVQPAAYGRHVTTHKPFLRAYQIGGESGSRIPPFWSIFTIADIEDLVVTDRTFAANPPDYQAHDKHMSIIYASL